MPQVNEFYWSFFSFKMLIIFLTLMLFLNFHTCKGIFLTNKKIHKIFNLFF